MGRQFGDQFFSGRWSVEERSLSINLRELWAIRFELHHFRHPLWGLTVGVFTDNTTAVSYVRKLGNVFRGAQPVKCNSSVYGRNL